MSNISIFVIAGALLLAMSGNTAAESLGLKDAVKLALEKNHLLLSSVHEHKAAEAGVKSSRFRYLPRITLEERAAWTNSATRSFMMKLDEGRFSLAGDLNNPPETADFQTSFSIEQPIFDMNLFRGLDVAGGELKVRSFAIEKVRQEVAYRVYEAYLNLQKNRASLAVAEQVVNDAREHQRIASVRTAAGVGLKFDELRIATFLAEMEQQKITAENAVILARLRLGQAIGLEPGALPDTSEHISAMAVQIDPAELHRAAQAGRSDLLQMNAEQSKAAAAVDAARGVYWPTLYAGGTYQLNDRHIPFGRDNDSWMIAATLRWDIFDSIRRKGDVEKAQALKDAGESSLMALRQEVFLQVQESLLRCAESEKRLVVARNAVNDAEEMVRLINKRFENALSTTVELLDAQTALNRSRAQLVENEANHALATARVYQSAGLFLKEVVK